MSPALAALTVGAAVALIVLAAGGRILGPARSLPAARRVRRLPPRVAAPLAAALLRGGVGVPPERALGLAAVATLAAVLAATALGASAALLTLAAVAPAAAGAVVLRVRISRRPERIAAQLPPVMRHVADAVRAGLSLRAALERAANDAPAPIREELGRVAEDLGQGARAEDALDGLAERAGHTDVDVAVCAILVTLRSGGDLPRILAELAGHLDARRRLAAELAGATGQARMTAWLVMALPAVGAVTVEALAPGTLGRNLGSGLGGIATAVSLTMFLTAALLVRRLARVTP